MDAARWTELRFNRLVDDALYQGEVRAELNHALGEVSPFDLGARHAEAEVLLGEADRAQSQSVVGQALCRNGAHADLASPNAAVAPALYRTFSLQGVVNRMRLIETEVAVIGGSLGGVAAALAALGGGARVVVTESTDWLGGQLTSQGVSAPDEHPLIEQFGGTARYSELRARVRQHYREHHGAPAVMPNGAPLNPGNGWVSRLCFEPRVGVGVIGEMLESYLKSGQLTVFYHHTPVAATVTNGSLRSVTLQHGTLQHGTEHIQVRAPFFLDATDLGELLPLCGAPFVTGAEAQSDTGEPHAPVRANPNEVQAMTYGFAVELCPGETHVITKPAGYERFRDAGLYTLTLHNSDGTPRRFQLFGRGDADAPPFWSYRRLLDAAASQRPPRRCAHQLGK